MKADIASHSVAAEQPSTSSPTSPQSFLSVIIPTRNEAGNIEPLLNRLERALKGIDFEVIFVDDSTDDTPDVIRAKGAQIAPDVTVIERPPERRNGLGMAVVEGMRAARSEWIVVMDGDLQHPPEVIREMVEEAQATQADLVVASRLSEGGSTAGLSWQRNLLSRGLALGMHICFPQNLRDISDPLTGFFLLRRSQISVDQLRPEGFKILLEVMIRNPHLKVAEVPFEFGKRHSGTSKANSSEMLRLMRQTLRLRLPALQPLFRFFSVGLSGIVVNSVLLFVFTELLGIYYLLSAVFATQGSTLWNFAWTESWVFRGRAQSPLNFWQRMAGFFAMNNALLVLRGPILALLVAQLGMNYLLANLVSLGALTVMRYAIADRLIWNAARGQVYHYNIHDIILVRSTHRLPELGYFRTSAFIDEPDYDVAVVADPAKYRTPESIVYDEMPGRFGFSIVINSGETTTKVYASPLVGKSPHVLYTNVIEPLLRWSFVRKGYALMHGACIALDDRALFITAQTDTGKTTTILKTIREHTNTWQFLSDDMTIVCPDGQVMNFPKPLTISQHTLRAVQSSVLTLREQLFLRIQSRLHSREGRKFALWLSKMNLPTATVNTVVQAIIPPPKYMVDRLIPGAHIIRGARLSHIAVIERGPEFEREIGDQEKVRILLANAEDAYGFPPYPMLAHELSSWKGEDLHTAEQAIVDNAIRAVPAVHIRRSNYDWYQRLLALLGDFQAEAPAQAPIPAPSLEGIPVFVAKNPSSNA